MARITNLATVRQARANMGLGEFAEAMGRKQGGDDARTMESTQAFHEAYHQKIEGEDGAAYMARRENYRRTWVERYTFGRLQAEGYKLTAKGAAEIVGMTRVERNAQDKAWELAVNCGSRLFTHFIVRPNGKGNGKGSQPVTYTRAQASAIKSVVTAQFGGDWKVFGRVVSALKPKTAK